MYDVPTFAPRRSTLGPRHAAFDERGRDAGRDRRRLLLVAGDPTLTAYVTLLLANWYEVTTASSADDAFEAALDLRPDAVLVCTTTLAGEPACVLERLRQIRSLPGYDSVEVLPLAGLSAIHGRCT